MRFLDPTASDMPAGQLPVTLQGANVLIVRPETTDLGQIPFETADHDRTDIETSVSVGANDSYQLKRMEIIRVGERVASIRKRLKNADVQERQRYLEEQLASSSVGVRVGNAEWEGLSPAVDSLRVSYEFEIDKALTAANPRMKTGKIPWSSRVNQLFGSLIPYRERKEPLALYGLKVNERETLRFKLPDGWRLESPPESKHIACPFGVGSFKYEVRAGELIAHRELVINGLLVAPDQYASFKEFLENVIREQQDMVLVLRK
jgi:hypothetical protein